MRLLILIIGIFQSGLSLAQEQGTTTFTGANDTVYVEPTNIVTSEKDGDYQLLPYRDRRPKWGVTAALGYSSYEPVNYEPEFFAGEFVDLYTNPEAPMIELQITVKRNLVIGSIGGEFAVGFYQNQADGTDIQPDSTLTLTPIRLGAIFYLDSIADDPWVVPYAAAGAYTMSYSESLPGGSGKGGTTQAALYFNGGAQMMLDWIDRKASRLSYEESGIEASYVYAEVRKQMASDNERDPNFETGDMSWAAGIRAEF